MEGRRFDSVGRQYKLRQFPLNLLAGEPLQKLHSSLQRIWTAGTSRSTSYDVNQYFSATLREILTIKQKIVKLFYLKFFSSWTSTDN